MMAATQTTMIKTTETQARLRIAGRDHGSVAALLFDKDGTLLEFNQLWLSWLQHLMHHLHKTASPALELDESLILQRLGVNASITTCDPAGPLAIGSMDDVTALLGFGLYEQGVAWNDALHLVRNSADHAESLLHARDIVALPGLHDLMAQAASLSLPLAVVTSDTEANARHHLRALGLSDAFAVVLGHDSTERGKPFPDPAWVACTRMGVSPESVALFGDSNGDMQMARRAKLKAAIGLCPNRIDRNHLADADQVIADFTDVVLTQEHPDQSRKGAIER
ncbi:MAG: HAD family phosphatase [Natronospirillum sp.]|uniref:HAD family hydrolase n=1 Tax=Natronospirillum sp. TaxID=2812955 RepID=UPI0025E8AE78|nr:HAD family phosphatase [Natronospirillum sp.]MCH8553070.1 HAD family phosphatase [Natronospirillum sp.]